MIPSTYSLRSLVICKNCSLRPSALLGSGSFNANRSCNISILSYTPIRREACKLKKKSSLNFIHSFTKEKSDRLRVLFFGSDEFSVQSLKAIHARRAELNIASIDVVCKPGQRIGRNLKQISEVPLRKAAEELLLPVHEIDGRSLEQWQPPSLNGEHINLLIAVSFGILIPAGLITSAKYGGLNLHPSRLPDLRGAAPLHHALLKHRSDIAITLQTLHPTKFDHGTILSQTDDLRIPDEIRMNGSVEELKSFLAPFAADHLAAGLASRLFIPPLQHVGKPAHDKTAFPNGISGARKITKEDGHVDWLRWPARKIIRRCQVLGSVWNIAQIHVPASAQAQKKAKAAPETEKTARVIMRGIKDYTDKRADKHTAHPRDSMLSPLSPGSLEVIVEMGKSYLGVWTVDQRFLLVGQLTVEGGPLSEHPVAALQRMRPGHFSLWKDNIRLL